MRTKMQTQKMNSLASRWRPADCHWLRLYHATTNGRRISECILLLSLSLPRSAYRVHFMPVQIHLYDYCLLTCVTCHSSTIGRSIQFDEWKCPAGFVILSFCLGFSEVGRSVSQLIPNVIISIRSYSKHEHEQSEIGVTMNRNRICSRPTMDDEWFDIILFNLFNLLVSIKARRSGSVAAYRFYSITDWWIELCWNLYSLRESSVIWSFIRMQ